MSKQADIVKDKLSEISSEYQTKYKEIQSKISTYKSALLSVGKTFSIEESEDKNGNKRTAVEVLVDQASFCGSKAETGTGNFNQSYAPPQPAAPSFSTGSDADFEEISGDDDLPF